MKKFLIVLFVVNIILICSTCFAKSTSVDIPDMIRIGLYYSKSVNSVTLSSPGGIEIGTMNENGTFTYEDETLPNEAIVVAKGSKTGAVYIDGYGQIGSQNEHPYFKSMSKDGLCLIEVDGKKYRGNIEIRRFADSDLTVINHLSMQEYLYGVLPCEISPSSSFEFVKAQAIVSRTYACYNYGKRSGLGFDLMPNTYDQVYGGYSCEKPNSNRAVDETNGQVIVYNGKVTGAYFFSTSGGYTENSENVWANEIDYLKAVPDTYEPNVNGNTTWEVTMTASEVKEKLRANGSINVGDIVDLVPTKYSDAGRVIELKIVGTNGETTITKQKVRSYLGLKSQWYTINDEAPTVESASNNSNDNANANDNSSSSQENDGDPDWYLKYDEEALQSEIEGKSTDYTSDEKNYVKEYNDGYKEEQNIVVEMKPLLSKIISSISNILGSNNNIETQTAYQASSSKKTFTFRGRGFGHAVGMSQNGAKGMAEAGFTAEEIIKWYYTGVSITK